MFAFISYLAIYATTDCISQDGCLLFKLLFKLNEIKPSAMFRCLSGFSTNHMARDLIPGFATSVLGQNTKQDAPGGW